MNILLVHKKEIVNNLVTITGDKLKHLRRILKVNVGDHVKIGIVDGKIGTGTVQAISKERALLQVQADQQPPERLSMHLILAIPRPIMLKRVLAQAASMGIEKISLLRSKRVEKSFLSSSIIAKDNYTPFLLKGIEQAVDTRLPEVLIYRRFKPFVEFTANHTGYPHKIIGHPQGNNSLKAAIGPSPNKGITVAIGPEGGWINYEVERFIEIGFTPFTLGERILRVDTAVPAILSQLQLLQQSPVT